jgi:cytochrome P450
MKLNFPPAPTPAHVRPDQVVDFDYMAVDAPNGEYQLRMRELLQAPGIPDLFWTPRNTGHWVAARADLIEKVLMDAETFSSSQITMIRDMNPSPPFAPLQIDPPDHMKYRALLIRALSPAAVNVLGEKARALAIELIEGFRHKGECEFISEFATHLPIAIFMSMLNLPEEDRPALLELADLIVRPVSMESNFQAKEKMDAYGLKLVAERKASPGNDLISDLLAAKIDGQPIPEQTLRGMVNLLLTAGLDTVASTMGFQARYLALHPELRQRLIAEPDSIAPAVEDMLRRFAIANMGRKVRKDCTLNGVELKAGDMILLPTPVFGLDERRFEHGEVVDIDRKDKIHMTFGAGVHRCMGSMLARVELRIFIEEWLKRIPDFQVKPGENVVAATGSVASIQRLPLVWEVK